MSETEAKKPESAGLLVDLGPLILFLAAYWWKGILFATPIFMAATAVSLIWSKIKTGKISPLLLFSSVTLFLFGSATIYFKTGDYLKYKPTFYYTAVSLMLFYGVIRDRPTLKAALGSTYPELRDSGWRILNRNFAWFFLAMAIANELVWRNFSEAFWVGSKLWGFLPATFLFGMANVPMILRHSDKAPEDGA